MFMTRLDQIFAALRKAEKQLEQHVEKCGKDAETNADAVRRLNEETTRIEEEKGRASKALTAVRNIIA